MKWSEKQQTAEIASETVPAHLRSVSFKLSESDGASFNPPSPEVGEALPIETIELEVSTEENADVRTARSVPLPSTAEGSQVPQVGQDLHGRSSRRDDIVFTVSAGNQSAAAAFSNSADPVANGVKLPLDYSSTSTLCSNGPIQPRESHRWCVNLLDNFSLVSMGLGLGNIWRLPALIYSNYPGETLIAYVILMTVVGLPLLLLEMTLGQFSGSGIIKTWQAVPVLKGIGVAQLLSGVYLTLYYPSLMTWAFQFGVSGIGKWQGCPEDLNLTVCLCDTKCDNLGNISLAEKCFQKEVLYANAGTGSASMNAKLLPMLAVSVIIIALCSSFGPRLMKLTLSISGLLTAVLLSASLALALTYRDADVNWALHGIHLLNPKELWAFGTGEVWYGAMVQMVFSLSVGFGSVPSMCSDRFFHGNVVRCAVLVWFFNILFGVVSVLAAFAWAGIGRLGDASVHDSAHFIYVVYYYAAESMWAGLAFALIFFAGINSMVPQFYAILHNLAENVPGLATGKAAIALCIYLWLLNIPAIIPVGAQVVAMWDHFAAGSTVLSCLIVHMLGWAWLYRSTRLRQDMEFMIQKRVNSIWSAAWATIVILLLTIAELWGFFGLPLDGSATCKYPVWLTAAGWSFYLLALVVAVLVCALVVLQQVDYGLKAKLLASLKPLRTWGPRDPLLHHSWKHWKRSADLIPDIRSKSANPLSVMEESVAIDSLKNSSRKRTSVSIVRVPSKRDYTAS